MEEHGANGIIKGAKYSFGLTVLGGRVGTGEAEVGAASSKEVSGGGVQEFSAIISLNTFDGQAELSLGESSELN